MASVATSKVAFVSGHTDLSQSDFDRIYVPLIDEALAQGHKFIIGDAVGVDAQTITYLLSSTVRKTYPNVQQQITVYASRGCNLTKFAPLGIKVIGPNDPKLTPTPEITSLIGIENEGKNRARYRHLVRDTHMTMNSDYDILYIRSEEESREMYGDKYWARVSATEHNRQRRERIKQRSAV